MKKKETIKSIEKEVRERVSGRTIKAVSYLEADEKESLSWEESSIVLELDDGTLIFPSFNDDGLFAGPLFIQLNGEFEVIPAI